MTRTILSTFLLTSAACASSSTVEPASSATSPSAASSHTLQDACEREATSLAADPQGRAVAIVVLDAQTGKLLAQAGRRGTANAPDLPSKEAFDPGSVMKTFTFATAIDKGALDPNARYSGGDADGYLYEGRRIHDSGVHAPMSADDVLAFSSNVGATQIFDRIGPGALDATLHGLHFEDTGTLPDLARAPKGTAASVATGGDVTIAPVALASAFRAVTVDGLYKSTAGTGGEVVVRPETAATLRGMLEHTVSRADGTGHLAAVAGYRVAGKTGTWSGENEPLVYGDFVGVVPASAPRFVILVGVSTTARGYSGGTIAAPAFARIAAVLLHDTNVPMDK